MAKTLLTIICGAALLVSMIVPGLAAPIATTPAERDFVQLRREPWMNKKITASTETLPLDEALRALSRAASLNAFADVTDFPADIQIKPYDQRPKDFFEMNYGGRINVIRNFTVQAQMTKDRVGRDTFVFWRRPDINRVVNLIAERHRELDAQFPTQTNEDAVAAIKAYYKRTQGWIAAPRNVAEQQLSSQGVTKSVKVSDLPAEVRQPLQAELLRRIRSERTNPIPSDFDLSSWQGARVLLVNEDANYFRPDGWVLGRMPVRAVRIYFPDRRPSYLVGIPAWANPKFPRVDNVELPAYLSEGAQLASFETGNLKSATTDAAPLPLVDFEGDARTKKQVEFSAKRQSLRALVADIQAQSGITLRVTDEVAPDAKVLAISSGMKTGEALEAIERLYQAVWVPNENGYMLQMQPMSELQTQMSRLGDHFDSAFDSLELRQRYLMGQKVAEEISIGLDRTQLQSPQGALFSELSDDVKSHIMQLFRDDNAGRLVEMQRRWLAIEPYLDTFEVQFNRASPDAKPFFVSENYQHLEAANFEVASTLRAFAPDGRYITRLFRDFAAEMPDKSDFEREKLQLESEEYMARTDPQQYETIRKFREMQAQKEREQTP